MYRLRKSTPADGLRRATGNLLENARRHGVPPVEIGLAREAGRLRITVSDHGAGLCEAELETAKQPFYRGNVARTGAQGTGLGLAIVERFARQCGGSLSLRNLSPQGLAAELSLPLQPVPAD